MDPAATYRRRTLESATPMGLVVLLYQAAITSLHRGLAAMEAGDIEKRTQSLNHVLAVIAELKSALNFERGGAVARQFALFYAMAERQILDASCRQDPEPLRSLLGPFGEIQRAWQQADARPRPGAAEAGAGAWKA